MNWHTIFHAFIRRLYYSRVKLLGTEHIPANGPVLALCLHRNGAVDGFVYRGALPRVAYMLKSTLRRSLMGKLFFDGVEVSRTEDGGRNGNAAVLDECIVWLQRGGCLGVFPEGTSALGPRHFPFKSGAARIAQGYLQKGLSLTVLPLGIHYERAWAFRSRVEIVIGPPVTIPSGKALASPGAGLLEIKHRFTAALESVGVNFPDPTTQELAQQLAYIATLGTDRSYFSALKQMEQQLPTKAVEAWQAFAQQANGAPLLRHQGVPLFPLRWPWAYALAALTLAVPVLLGAVMNALPLAVAWWAGCKFPDDLNVIALWRILTGVPILILWAVLWLVAGTVSGLWWLPLLYFSFTYLAVLGWYRLKKFCVVAWNGIVNSKLRGAALKIHHAVLDALPDSRS